MHLPSNSTTLCKGRSSCPISASQLCQTSWETNGIRMLQTAFATELHGARADGPVPAPDSFAVFLAKFIFTNTEAEPRTASLPMSYKAGDAQKALRVDNNGLAWLGD